MLKWQQLLAYKINAHDKFHGQLSGELEKFYNLEAWWHKAA